MTKLGFVSKVSTYLNEAGIKTFVFDDCEVDPSRENAKAGAAFLLECTPDLIIGLGGGSAIDAGKAMWILYEYPNAKWEDLFVPFTGVPKLRQKAKYIAIPSTSGTSSELSLASVVTNRGVFPNKKDFTLSYEVTPDMAILDPELPSTMPPSITANTGYDLLVHACESYVSKGRSDITDAMCIAATKQGFAWLPKAYANGTDPVAREKMHNACLMAGMTFTQTALGLCHSTAHQIGAEWRIPHGLANSLMSIPVVQFNMAIAGEKYGDLARACGKDPKNALEGGLMYIEAMKELKQVLNLPTSIQSLGIDEKEFLDKVDSLAVNALADGSTPTNPRIASKEEVIKILKAGYYGVDLA